jgi:hypothetical protein
MSITLLIVGLSVLMAALYGLFTPAT